MQAMTLHLLLVAMARRSPLLIGHLRSRPSHSQRPAGCAPEPTPMPAVTTGAEARQGAPKCTLFLWFSSFASSCAGNPQVPVPSLAPLAFSCWSAEGQPAVLWQRALPSLPARCLPRVPVPSAPPGLAAIPCRTTAKGTYLAYHTTPYLARTLPESPTPGGTSRPVHGTSFFSLSPAYPCVPSTRFPPFLSLFSQSDLVLLSCFSPPVLLLFLLLFLLTTAAWSLLFPSLPAFSPFHHLVHPVWHESHEESIVDCSCNLSSPRFPLVHHPSCPVRDLLPAASPFAF